MAGPRKKQSAHGAGSRSKKRSARVADNAGESGGGDDGDQLAEDKSGDESEDEDEDGDGEVLIGEIVSEDDEDDDGDIDAELDRLGTPLRDAKASDRHLGLIKHDPLSAYIQETKRYPLLSREEEHDLAVKLVENEDADAARRLIEANLRLVVKISYEYRRAYRNLLDLIQEGNIGLMQAVRKYDPYRGVKLSSYAAWWIRAYILKFILNNWRLVKIGTTQAQRKLFFNLRKERERLEQLGFTPTPALLAENLDVTEKEVVEMEKRLSAPDASLDAPMQGEEDGAPRTRMDYLPTEETDRPDRQVAQSQFQELLREKLERFAETLEGREETIFRERWLTDTPSTLQQIGDQYGVSRERARQLEKRLLGRLRKYLEAELGTAVDIDALSRE
ncbi:RNA polymerase factor sigma-32 [Haliangium ochraceum]|uniref:RNA polymerase sigma factor n=1 Tax=Haliangium ochraceum (strain DSM 14365 / JCM 11303 / SMP-2) TaxID=502025 RepID=D0LKK3_HALO1|nr:RNA polymerase factor sigma-32 [Haliangium ochraceum]ACY15051.1 putative RNA polymerase, sigma 70 family subunit [Haliangium ochraceum DSM 14365]